jgi:hypothetical protein
VQVSPYLALGWLLTAGWSWAQTAASGRAESIEQPPAVDVLDFFGLNKIPEARIRRVLGFKEGDPFPRSKGDVEELLDAQPDIVETHLEAVCCDAGKTILYVGIEEPGAPHFDLREPPEGNVELPPGILADYRDFLDAYASAVRRNTLAEDLTRGHSLMTDPLAREIQLKFPDLAKQNLLRLRDVLRNSSDDEQRSAAAYVMAYAPDKRIIVDDLQFALRDADPAVRANSVRGLVAIAIYARLNPDLAIRIEPTWFIEMLNSLSWSDRDHALKALQILTDTRDASTMGQLRERALPALVEMSRWKTLAHALPAFVLVGRLAGFTEPQIQDAWTRGDREMVIAVALGKKKR